MVGSFPQGDVYLYKKRTGWTESQQCSQQLTPREPRCHVTPPPREAGTVAAHPVPTPANAGSGPGWGQGTRVPALSLGGAGIQGRRSGSAGAWEFTTPSLTHTGQTQNVQRTGASALTCHVPPGVHQAEHRVCTVQSLHLSNRHKTLPHHVYLAMLSDIQVSKFHCWGSK